MKNFFYEGCELAYDDFMQRIKDAAAFFESIPNNQTLRIISHLDADGICSVSLVVKLLNLRNKKYSVSIVPNLTEVSLQEFQKESYEHYIFSDLGSGAITQIASVLKEKKILVLDHHTPESKEEFPHIMHVNPHFFGIDGGSEISGAGVAFLFARQLEKSMEEYAHIAVIGAVGDIQDKQGFHGLNKEILSIAVKKGKVKIEKSLRFFGIHTRPLYKILQYSSDPKIPGVSGSESAAIQFLHQVTIDPKKGNEWRLFMDLTDDEKKRLALGIIMKRKDFENPADIFGDTYFLLQEKDPELKNVKEFATLLNSCGRLGKASLGIGACLNDPSGKKKAIACLNQYKREIIGAMNWYRENLETEYIMKQKGYMIINAEDNILPTMIGTISSMIAKSGELEDKTYLLALARNPDRTTKVSLRITGENETVDLREIIAEITKKVGGEAGGHMNAAGAIIATRKEKEFIEAALQVLKKAVMEEVLVD